MLTLETVVEQQRMFSHEGLSWVKESTWSKHPLCAILWWGGGRWTEASREVWVSPRVGGLSWFFRQSLERPCTSQKNKQTKNWGLPLLTCRQKAKKKCLQMGVRCDSQVLRVSVKLSLEGRDLMGVMLASKSPRNGSSSERAESTERTTDTQLPRGSHGGSSSFPGASEPQPFLATRNHLWK